MNIREVNISYGIERVIDAKTISRADSAIGFLRSIAPDNSREHVLALYLDGSHKPIAYSVIATGTATECSVHPREVFQRAVAVGARSLIMAHNHPSQDVTPSKEDQAITDRIRGAGELLGIRLLDHIVFSDTDFFSFQESGRL